MLPVLSNACDDRFKFEQLMTAKPKGMIVGCGEKPFAWQPTSSERGQVNYWEKTQDGDHTHSGYITVAESKDVNPDIVQDWTQPIPVWMHNSQPDVYLEKLPPNIMEIRQCFTNAWNALKPGGKFVFDHQICQVKGDGYNVVSPFSISVPALNVTYPHLASAEKKREITSTAFYSVAGIKKGDPMSKEEFEKLLLSNPYLAELNKQMYELNLEINNKLIPDAQKTQLEKCWTLRPALNTEVCRYTESFGFTDAKIEVGRKDPNPYNKRRGSTLVFATKPL